MMSLFYISVFVPLPRLDLLPLHPVISQQPGIAFGELRRRAHVVHRRRQSIGSVPLWHFPEFPNCILESFTQALEALRKTHRRRFPVRVGQHQVIEQVRKTLPLDRDPQLTHMREVGSAQPPWLVSLREEHFLHRSFRSSPYFHSSLQRPQLPIGESPRITPLQILKDRLCFQPRVHLQQAPHFFPHLLKGILSCPPPRSWRQLARHLSQPSILARRLRIHPRFRRRGFQIRFHFRQGKQPPHPLVCHQILSAAKNTKPELGYCRRSGILIVVAREF